MSEKSEGDPLWKKKQTFLIINVALLILDGLLVHNWVIESEVQYTGYLKMYIFRCIFQVTMDNIFDTKLRSELEKDFLWRVLYWFFQDSSANDANFLLVRRLWSYLKF